MRDHKVDSCEHCQQQQLIRKSGTLSLKQKCGRRTKWRTRFFTLEGGTLPVDQLKGEKLRRYAAAQEKRRASTPTSSAEFTTGGMKSLSRIDRSNAWNALKTAAQSSL